MKFAVVILFSVLCLLALTKSDTTPDVHMEKINLELTRDEIRDLQKKYYAMRDEGKTDEAESLQLQIKEKMTEYQKLREKISPDDLDRPLDPRADRDDLRSRREDRHAEELRARMEERRRSRPDRRADFGHHRDGPRSHEDRAKNEKEQHEKHREFLGKRKDDFLARIERDGFGAEEAASLTADVHELHRLENTLVDSRMQITLDFEGVRDITDKVKRREYLDRTKKRREEQREVDNVSRDRISSLRDKIEHRLREKERTELRS